MPLVTVKPRFQVTIPAKLRTRAHVHEGDILEATLVEGGILLRPKAVVDRDAVAINVEALLGNVPSVPGDQGKSEDEIMDEVVSEIARTRASRRKRGR
ncbi:MAG: AbrB/MazE/SpoVT family DNA-binding domain-containing protein [Magnetospirillum sp. WYHS-4]